jgi:hypothetical protein
MKAGDLLISAFLLIVFIAALGQSSHWPWEARALPALASGLGVVLVLVLVLPKLRSLRSLDFRGTFPRRDMLALLTFMTSVTGVILFGIFWGGLLLVFSYTYFALGRNLPKAAIASLPVLLLPLLELGLQVQFFQGLFRLPPPY